MTPRNNAWLKVISTTERNAETLARRHGYRTAEDLAKSLPPHARVLDVGAGASTLGKEITKLRQDIHWANLDFSYQDARILKDVSQGIPSNLEFIVGDAAKLDMYIKPASMDVIFSYWLFPHLASYDQQTALTAASQLYKATKAGGLLVVGPCKPPLFRHPFPWSKSWRVIKSKDLTADFYSHEVLRRTNLSGTSHYVRNALNTAASEIFTTSYYVRGSNVFTLRVYDPSKDKYIRAYSPRAIYLVGEFLARAIVRLTHPQRPTEGGQ